MSYNKKLFKQMLEESKQKKTSPNPFGKDKILDPMGQWKFPGQVTRIPSNRITMQGVPYPVKGVGSSGQKQMMYPGQEYSFPGSEYVDEYPLMKNGGEPTPLELAKIKAKMALESHFGNLAARRMTTPYPQSLVFKKQDGKIGRGTHYVYNQDNFVFPAIQEGSNGKLFYNQNASPYDREAMRFNSPEDAASFAQYYKYVAPMMRSFRKNGGDISIPNLEEGGWLNRYDDEGPLPRFQTRGQVPYWMKRPPSDISQFVKSNAQIQREMEGARRLAQKREQEARTRTTISADTRTVGEKQRAKEFTEQVNKRRKDLGFMEGAGHSQEYIDKKQKETDRILRAIEVGTLLEAPVSAGIRGVAKLAPTATMSGINKGVNYFNSGLKQARNYFTKNLIGNDKASKTISQLLQTNYINKQGLPTVSTSEIEALIKKQIDWLNSDEYAIRRMASTGESLDEIRKSTSKWINELTKRNTNDVFRINPNLKDAGTYGLRKDNSNIISTLMGKTKPRIAFSPGERSNMLHTIDHEILHALSPALKNEKLYKNYPILKTPQPEERTLFQKLFNKKPYTKEEEHLLYLSDEAEQQVRGVRLYQRIIDDLNIPEYRPITQKEFDDWITNYFNKNANNYWDEGFDDVAELLEAAGNEAKNKGFSMKKSTLDWLNKVWAVPPAVIGAKSLQEKKEGGENNWLSRYDDGRSLPKFQNGKQVPYWMKRPSQGDMRTNFNLPSRERILAEERAKQTQYKGATLSQGKKATPKSKIDRAIEIATNPVTAFGYAARGQKLPENLNAVERNVYDNAMDIINPAGYIKSASELPGQIKEGDLLGAGLNALALYPGARVLRSSGNLASKQLPKQKIFFSKKLSNINNYPQLSNLERYPEVTSKNIGKLSDDYIKELKEYAETPIFRKRVEKSFPNMPFEEYKRRYLQQLEIKPEMYTHGKHGSYESNVGGFFSKSDNLEISPDMTVIYPTSPSSTLYEEISHQAKRGDELLPDWLKNQTGKNIRRDALIDDVDYMSLPEEFDAKLQVLRRDLKDLGVHDYTKGTIPEDKFDDFFNFQKRNRRFLSDQGKELFNAYRPEFIYKGLKYLPATIPIAVGAGALQQKKQGGEFNTTTETTRPPIYTDDPNDPRLKTYQDSLAAYKTNIWPENNEPIKKYSVPKKIYKIVGKDKDGQDVWGLRPYKPTNIEPAYQYDYIDNSQVGKESIFEKIGKIKAGNRATMLLYKKPVQPYIFQEQPQLKMVGNERRDIVPSFNTRILSPKAFSSFDPTQARTKYLEKIGAFNTMDSFYNNLFNYANKGIGDDGKVSPIRAGVGSVLAYLKNPNIWFKKMHTLPVEISNTEDNPYGVTPFSTQSRTFYPSKFILPKEETGGKEKSDMYWERKRRKEERKIRKDIKKQFDCPTGDCYQEGGSLSKFQEAGQVGSLYIKIKMPNGVYDTVDVNSKKYLDLYEQIDPNSYNKSDNSYSLKKQVKPAPSKPLITYNEMVDAAARQHAPQLVTGYKIVKGLQDGYNAVENYFKNLTKEEEKPVVKKQPVSQKPSIVPKPVVKEEEYVTPNIFTKRSDEMVWKENIPGFANRPQLKQGKQPPLRSAIIKEQEKKQPLSVKKEEGSSFLDNLISEFDVFNKYPFNAKGVTIANGFSGLPPRKINLPSKQTIKTALTAPILIQSAGLNVLGNKIKDNYNIFTKNISDKYNTFTKDVSDTYDEFLEYAEGLKSGAQRFFDKIEKEDKRAITKKAKTQSKQQLVEKDNKVIKRNVLPYGFTVLKDEDGKDKIVRDVKSTNPKDSLVEFMNVFNNDLGVDYIVGNKVKEVTKAGAPSKFSNVQAVGHFLRDSDILPNQKIAPKTWKVSKGYEYTSTSPGKALSATGFDDPERYRMLYKKKDDNNRYTIKYVKNKDLTEEQKKNYETDFTVSGYHNFSDIDWNAEGPSTGYKAVSKWLPLKNKKGHTYIPYKDKNAFSRFSGGSITYLFRDPLTGENLGVDVGGSVNSMKKVGEDIIRMYNIKPEELKMVYHDMGSYSAKPKAKDGVLDYNQWIDYNTYNKGFSGAPLMIPIKKNGGETNNWLDKYN